MAYLKEQGYRVLALRDLERYVDLSEKPTDPGWIIRERSRGIRAQASDSR